MANAGGSGDPATEGKWQDVLYRFNHLPVHMAILRTGKVLALGGSGNDEYSLNTPYPAELWNPETGEIETIDQQLGGDVFCCGQVVLPDGRVLVAGGTYRYDGKFLGLPIPPFSGLDRSYTFDPMTEQWTRAADLSNGRWYPTLVALGDGRIIAMAGLTKGFPWVFLRSIEVYSQGLGWQKLVGVDRWLPLYPRLHLLPSGDIFYSGSYNTHYTFPFSLSAFPTSALDVGRARWKSFGLPNKSEREEGVSVLLPMDPPEYKPRVLLAGGGTPQGKQATADAEVIDLSAENPKWRKIQSMSFERYYAYAVILPDKNVFVIGGRIGTAEMNMGAGAPMQSGMGQTAPVGDLSHDPAAILDTEVFDPTTEAWTKTAKMTVDRLYHSNALLLPDGRVMTAGSNPARRTNELRIETYCPPYFYKGERPIIENYLAIIRYGLSFEIKTPSSGEIESVALIRPGATTHCVNTEQRYVGLQFASTSSSTITANVPHEKNLAPPGYYLLFVVTYDRIPSVGKFVKLE
jgi:hypothetical protein